MDCVCAIATDQDVIARTTYKEIVAGAASQIRVAGAARNAVITAATKQDIPPRSADDRVVATTAFDPVIADPRVLRIGTIAADDDVVSGIGGGVIKSNFRVVNCVGTSRDRDTWRRDQAGVIDIDLTA